MCVYELAHDLGEVDCAEHSSGEGVDDRRTAEVWTFERNLRSRNPNWILIHVGFALSKIDAMEASDLKKQKDRLKRAAKQTPLLLSSISGAGVPEALRALIADYRLDAFLAALDAMARPRDKVGAA